MFVGRTQYQIAMFDEKTRTRRWNATFTDYSSHVLPEDTTYNINHYGVCSDGRLVTVDRETGGILWQRKFNSTVVAIYVLQANGLHKLPYTVMGAETYSALLEVRGDNHSSYIVLWLQADQTSEVTDLNAERARAFFVRNHDPQHGEGTESLRRTLFVGESSYGLYAIPTLVDDSTILITNRKNTPPLLDGPSAIDEHEVVRVCVLLT